MTTSTRFSSKHITVEQGTFTLVAADSTITVRDEEYNTFLVLFRTELEEFIAWLADCNEELRHE